MITPENRPPLAALAGGAPTDGSRFPGDPE
jgi:hypothetical protein